MKKEYNKHITILLLGSAADIEKKHEFSDSAYQTCRLDGCHKFLSSWILLTNKFDKSTKCWIVNVPIADRTESLYRFRYGQKVILGMSCVFNTR